MDASGILEIALLFLLCLLLRWRLVVVLHYTTDAAPGYGCGGDGAGMFCLSL